jgi:hypothetical protein
VWIVVGCLLAVAVASCGEGFEAGDAAPRQQPLASLDKVAPARLARSVDEGVAQLTPAQITFNHPTTLRLDETEQIQVLASFDQEVADLKRLLTEIGQQEGAQIDASDEMFAQLESTGFDIKAITPAQQALGSGVTEWRWEIEPTEVGPQELHLTMSAIMLLDVGTVMPRPVAKRVETFDRTLTVEAIPKPPKPWHEKLTDFLSDNWQWLITTAVLPLGAWLLARRAKSSKKSVARKRRRSRS